MVEPQHIQAINRANYIRLGRAKVKDTVKDGTRTAADVLAESPDVVQSMWISELLLCQPRWGWTKVRSTLAKIPMPENKAIGAMTSRQRDALIDILNRRKRK